MTKTLDQRKRHVVAMSGQRLVEELALVRRDRGISTARAYQEWRRAVAGIGRSDWPRGPGPGRSRSAHRAAATRRSRRRSDGRSRSRQEQAVGILRASSRRRPVRVQLQEIDRSITDDDRLHRGVSDPVERVVRRVKTVARAPARQAPPGGRRKTRPTGRSGSSRCRKTTRSDRSQRIAVFTSSICAGNSADRLSR